MGVLEGSVIGAILWNAVYEDLLRKRTYEGCYIIGYAENIALDVTDAKLDGVTRKLSQGLVQIRGWLSGSGVRIAEGKKEIMFLSNKKAPPCLAFRFSTGSSRRRNRSNTWGWRWTSGGILTLN